MLAQFCCAGLVLAVQVLGGTDYYIGTITHTHSELAPTKIGTITNTLTHIGTITRIGT